MRIGAIFPTNEIGEDPAQIRAFVQALEDLGYDHVLAFDHVLGADPARLTSVRVNRPGGPYQLKDQFHEPFVLFGYIAAMTTRLEMGTSVLVLPQRQTALVAKQAAEIDVLSGGRLRLGVGIGWNFVEYESLGVEFRQRGARLEEQVAVLRALWTQPRVDFKGRWHTIDGAGINPLPVQRPIPIWFGGTAEPMLKRLGRIGDGWFPNAPLGDELIATIERVRDYAEQAGRSRDAVQIEGRIVAGRGGPEDWAELLERWRGIGASHVSFRTLDAGFTSLDQHIEALREFRQAVDLANAARR